MSRKRKRPYDKSVYRSLALVTQFGIGMLVPICMMSALGIWLDKKLGTSFLMILFFFMGAVAGGQNVYRVAKKIYSTPNSKKDGYHENNGKKSESELICEDTGNSKREE